VQSAAGYELSVLSGDDIERSGNVYLRSFAQVLNGRSPVRRYHEKALEVAALEIKRAQLIFGNDSIGIIMLAIVREDANNSLGLASLFDSIISG
jgi:hypothetical protein